MILFILILFLFILAVYFIIRKIYDRLWSKGLTAQVSFEDKYAYEGERTNLNEVIVNNKLLIIPALEIDFNMNRSLRFTDSENSMVSDKLYRRDVFSVGSRKKITRSLELLCIKRGYFTLNNVGLMANDLFMVKKYLAPFSQSEEFYVYPRRINSNRIAIPFNRLMGEVLSREKMYDDPFEFAGIRDYMVTDPMKNVNWKASAKSGNLVVNLHDSSLTQKIDILLDTYDSKAPIDDELNEESIRVAAAMCERIMANGTGLSLWGNGTDLLSGKKLGLTDVRGQNPEPVRKTLSRLAWDDTEDAAEFIGRLRPQRNAMYVFISKNINDRIIKALAALSSANSVMWILPYKGEKPSVQEKNFRVVYWAESRGGEA